uniref:Uncharacterized protein n=2 Tax=Oryza TaxID=4527 RepID=A0A0E0QVP3_ORYRU
MQVFINWWEITKTELRMLQDKGNMWHCMRSAISLFRDVHVTLSVKTVDEKGPGVFRLAPQGLG